MTSNADRPGTAHEAMRGLADCLDEADRLIDDLAEAKMLPRSNSGDGVQRDLRALAEWFKAHPAEAEDAWAFVCEEEASAPAYEWGLQMKDRTDSDWDKPETLRLIIREDSLSPLLNEKSARARAEQYNSGPAGPDFVRVVKRAVGRWVPC